MSASFLSGSHLELRVRARAAFTSLEPTVAMSDAQLKDEVARLGFYPYLVPQAFRGKLGRNEPANLVHTAAFLAELRDVPVERLAAMTTANARRLFRLPGP